MLREELLVPEENDDPSEITEFGRRVDLTSGKVPEKELRNFGAKFSIIKINFNR